MRKEWKPLRPLAVLISLCAATCLAACGGGGGGTTATQPTTPTAVLSLQWDSNTEPDMDHYLVYYDNVSRAGKPYPNPAKNVPKQAGVTTSYTLSGLVPGQKYYVRVSAVDSSGSESSLSNEVNGNAK